MNITIENISQKEQIFATSLLSAYQNDVKCEYSTKAVLSFSKNVLSGMVLPDKKIIGWYAIEAPLDWQEIELHFKESIFADSMATCILKK